MQIYTDQSDCPYLPGRLSNIHYFFANQISAPDLDFLLKNGWRKFGSFYFRDDCSGCWQCIPIRVPVKDFFPNKSQRRILKKNARIQVHFGPLKFSDEIYEIYVEHSRERFGNDASLNQFIHNFYQPSCPALQSEYYLDGKLIGVGYLDCSSEALSSVYFIYRKECLDLSLGNFSVLKEIEYAKNLNLNYYYLGYYVPGNASMQYKNKFHPNEKMDWHTGLWKKEEDFIHADI